jgi:hypothetical protein
MNKRARQKLFITTKQQEYLDDRKRKLQRLRHDGLYDLDRLQEPVCQSAFGFVFLKFFKKPMEILETSMHCSFGSRD